ncbi:hypothetical protein [Natronorubrum daqingense]|uniref:Uncharacterized protein n=1 Tax=Natronorubrum daqingense TaxID=588898 RepID=A0A1N6XBL0_9EURY|nr:hypothetical protein [Natronorubrum daqingense]APX95994.1 hypothetical protein BB347_04815 [Natronorubrum daqingense]SIQ99744.1 hypothetical protein SAMN05421809_0069 [Natronorubrum daqingense]
MKWRCTWCGKPHESDDPPCDSCGHNEFEKAVVRQQEFETVDTGTQYMWVCSNCGRQHMKNNPPCSRCGDHDLEKVEQTYDDVGSDLEVPSWLEVAKPYAPIIAVFGLIVVLFATGIISPSIIPGVGTPSPPDAPGDGATAAGIDLEATEEIIHEQLDAERESTRTYDGGMAAYAEYINRAEVASEYDDANPDSVEPADFGADCSGEIPVWPGIEMVSVDEYDDEDELASAVTTAFETSGSEEITGDEYDIEGMDLHAVDGQLYVTYAAC